MVGWMENVVGENSLLIQEDIPQKLLLSIGILVVFWLINKYICSRIRKHTEDVKDQFNYRKIVTAVFIGIYTTILFIVWYDKNSSLGTFIGIFTAGLAIAMKDIIINMAGGLYILWASPFKIGDRIEIGGHIGDVIDLGVLQFALLEVGNRVSGEQSTGRIIHIPNMNILSMSLANYEKGFRYIWHEINVTLQKDSNWEQAKEIMYGIVNESTSEIIEEAKGQIHQAGKKYLIYYANLTPIVYTSVQEGKIILTIRYLCEPRKLRTTEHLLWEQLLRELKEHEDIHLL